MDKNRKSKMALKEVLRPRARVACPPHFVRTPLGRSLRKPKSPQNTSLETLIRDALIVEKEQSPGGKTPRGL